MNPLGKEINKSVLTEMETSFIIFLIEKFSEKGVGDTVHGLKQTPLYYIPNTLASGIYYPLPLTACFASFLKLQVLLNIPTDCISKQLPLKTLIPQKPVFADFDFVTY